MVRRRKSTRRRKVALKRRKNPVRGRRWMYTTPKSSSKKSSRRKSTRKSLRKRARSTASVTKHRPTLYKTRQGWRRSKRSRYRIPGIKRMNPMKLFSQKNLTMLAGYAAGTAAGFMVLPVIYQAMPAQLKNRKFIGLGNVALGALMFGYLRNKTAKNAGIMIAATGLYDMLSVNFTALGLPVTPTSNWLTAQLKIGAPAAPKAGEAQGLTYEVNGQPVLGLSYDGRAQVPSTVGLSYEAPMGSSWEADSDNPYNGVYN